MVGVVGASARAAVHSLARAGFAAWAVDLFADRDLACVASCRVCPFSEYPGALPYLAARFPPGPVLYTGGLENYPNIVAELALSRELWSNPPAVLEAVRDPFRLSVALTEANLTFPALVPPGSPCPMSGRYLRKPLRSAGGLGIRFAQPCEPADDSHYFQEFIDGVSMSALFRDVTLFGISEQLIGEPGFHAAPFAYCGNIGPFPAGGELVARVEALGRVVATAFGLRGVWGIDFMLKADVPYMVEVNPRYTAAVEVLEHGLGHAAFLAGPSRTPRGVIGKAIYFAPHAITFPNGGPWDADLVGDFNPWRLPGFADIPEVGSRIEAGHPVLTILLEGSSPAYCRLRLQSRAAELDQLFAGNSP